MTISKIQNVDTGKLNYKTYTITGEVEWFKVYPHNHRLNRDTGEPEISLNIELSQEELDKLKKEKLFKNTKSLVKNKEGDTYVSKSGKTFIALSNKVKTTNGKTLYPTVVKSNADGTAVLFKEEISNGSKVTLKIKAFPYKNSKGQGYTQRITAINIIEYTPFIRTNSLDLEGLGLSNEQIQFLQTQKGDLIEPEDELITDDDDDYVEVVKVTRK